MSPQDMLHLINREVARDRMTLGEAVEWLEQVEEELSELLAVLHTELAMSVELDRERLPMWVVYNHPSDYPEDYVARIYYSLPAPAATFMVIRSKSLASLQDFLLSRGAIKFARDPNDDPAILEVWIV